MHSQFFPSEKSENEQFKQIVYNRRQGNYFPSFKVADMVGLSGRALSKITSSFMVLTSDHQKSNVRLSLKFEAKAMKVIDYSRKDGRTWEYSQKAVDLIKEYKVQWFAIWIYFSFISHILCYVRLRSQTCSPPWIVQEMVRHAVFYMFFSCLPIP